MKTKRIPKQFFISINTGRFHVLRSSKKIEITCFEKEEKTEYGLSVFGQPDYFEVIKNYLAAEGFLTEKEQQLEYVFHSSTIQED